MITKFSMIILLCSVLIITSKSYSQAESDIKKPTMTILKIDKELELTGKLDNPIWLKAEPIELKYEVEPGDNTPSPQRTVVRALYDEKYIYFGFECFDTNPEQIRANISDRDKLYQDDWVFVGLDTYGDFQRSYEFCVNPFGIMGDLLATSNNEDASVDWIWHASASKNETGWTAEMKIPFSSLNFPDAEVQNFRANILRTIPRSSRVQISWTSQDRNIPGFMSQAGYLTGIQNIKSGSSIGLLPYAVGQKMGSLSNMSNPNSDFKFDPIQTRIGGGIKYSPGTNFSLDAVINPDFSQIESDAAQISVNTTFALYYNEKRPFFLIGQELLQTQMYYSRSINDPLAAARINGKTGSLSYLYMGAYDRNTVFVIPGEERSNTVATNLKSVVNIGRLRYNLGNESYVGSYIMTRNLDGGHNYLLGVDWNYRFWDNWNFLGEGFFSQTQELNEPAIFNSSRMFGSTEYNAAFNGEKYSGNGIRLGVNYNSTAYYAGLNINSYSPTYQTYNGLFTSNAYHSINFNNQYMIYSKDSFIDRGSLGISTYLKFNYDGLKREQEIQPYINASLKGPINLHASYLLVNDEQFGGTFFKGINRIFMSLSSNPINEISFSSYAELGKFIYRSSSPTMGYGHNFSASVTLKPTSQLNISFSYSRARLSDNKTNELFYDGNIYRAVGNYQFSSEILFRTIFQYDSFNKAFQFYPLFSYKLNAFTTFYAGATSNYLDYGEGFGVKNIDQQYFVKVQYLLGT